MRKVASVVTLAALVGLCSTTSAKLPDLIFSAELFKVGEVLPIIVPTERAYLAADEKALIALSGALSSKRDMESKLPALVKEQRIWQIEKGNKVKIVKTFPDTFWCEVEILDGKHKGKRGLLSDNRIGGTERREAIWKARGQK